MLKKIIKINILLSILGLTVFGQSNNIKLPNDLLKHRFDVKNFKEPTLMLSDYSGKVIILDFWATWCSNCISSFSKNDSLQNTFSKDLQIILVNSSKGTGDDEEKVSNFFQKYKARYPKFSLPSIYLDSLLEKRFVHSVLPHYVWIGRNGEVLAQTSASQINEKNIIDAINGKLDIQTPFNNYSRSVPVFSNVDIYSLKTKHIQSSFTSFIDGIGSGRVDQFPGRVTWRNLRMIDHYKNLFRFQNNRAILEVKSPDKFLAYKPENMFCYELIYPESLDLQERDKIIKEDLNRYSDYQGKWEMREVNCWVFSIMNQKLLPSGKGYLKNEIETLNEAQNVNGLIFINETGINQRILANSLITPIAKSGIVNDKIVNVLLYKEYLNTIGLDIHLEKRKLQMFVISERKFLTR